MSEQLKAPWTPDDVRALFDSQTEGVFHPYTCPNRGDGNHRHVGRDLGMLIPTIKGWVCLFCDYTQDWAHTFSTEGHRKNAGSA